MIAGEPHETLRPAETFTSGLQDLQEAPWERTRSRKKAGNH
ncbi:MAG: hypothetical protein RIQ81_1887 [Pseudomonadota bacterium]